MQSIDTFSLRIFGLRARRMPRACLNYVFASLTDLQMLNALPGCGDLGLTFIDL